MTREWKDGDVAAVTGPWEAEESTERPAARYGKGWFGLRRGYVHHSEVTSVRPLLLFDPDDAEQIDAVCKALVEQMHRAGDRASAANGVHPSTVAEAVRSLLAPPKPPEPLGLGAVVEDEHGVRWVRLSEEATSSRWRSQMAIWRVWSEFTAVRVLSEGIPEVGDQ